MMSLSSVYAIDDLSTVFTNNNGTITGTSNSLNIVSPNKSNIGYASVQLNGSGFVFSCSWTRTQSGTTPQLFNAVSGVQFSNLSGCTVAANGTSLITDSNATSGTFTAIYEGNSTGYINFLAAAESVAIGSAQSSSFIFTQFILNGVNYVGGSEPLKSYFQLQNGYVVVFDLGNNTAYDISLKGYSEELSTWLGNSFERTNQTYWFSDSLPSESDSMPAVPNTKIVWEEDEPKNIFGQTHYMKTELSGTSSGRYLFVYNPAVHLKVSGSGRNETQVKNSPLDVSIDPNITVYVYDTQGSLSLINGGGLVGNIVGSYGVATSTTSGGSISFTNPDTEQQYIQISGGSTDTSSIDDKSVQGFLQELKETLDYFVETIISLLSAPISHIKQLISVGSEFMNTLAGLFTWLPAPVISVLVSALVVLVVVGVFKIFL